MNQLRRNTNMRKLLNFLAILILVFTVQVTHAQNNKGAIAIEDCIAYDSNMIGRMSKNKIEIKAGHIFAFGPLTTTAKTDDFSKTITNNGFLRVYHLKDPIRSQEAYVIWVPEKSVQIFESKMVGGPWPFKGDDLGVLRGGWKPGFVRAALEAAPEKVKEQMGWAKDMLERAQTTSRPATTVASNSTVNTTQTQQNRQLTIADLKGGLGRYVLVSDVARSQPYAVWKDGKRYSAPNFKLNSLFVSGDNVYIAGSSRNQGDSFNHATLWTNGTPQELDTVASETTVVYVHGDDVYVAGTRGALEARRPVLWKNGILTETLSESRGGNSWVPTHISVYNGNVYVAGSRGMAEVMLWKNGKDTNIINTLTGNRRRHIEMNLLIDDEIYSIQSIYPKRYLFKYSIKNDQVQQVYGEYDEINNLYISNKNVYISGTRKNKAMLWKNNVEQKLEGFENPESLQEISTYAAHVFASGDNIYVFGYRASYSAGGKDYPDDVVLWKNGVVEILPGFRRINGWESTPLVDGIVSVFVVE